MLSLEKHFQQQKQHLEPLNDGLLVQKQLVEVRLEIRGLIFLKVVGMKALVGILLGLRHILDQPHTQHHGTLVYGLRRSIVGPPLKALARVQQPLGVQARVPPPQKTQAEAPLPPGTQAEVPPPPGLQAKVQQPPGSRAEAPPPLGAQHL